MTTYVLRDGKLIEKSKAAPLNRGPFVVSDYLPELKHPITGKRMDSKSQFRAVTRAYGCVEVGNDTQRDTRRLEGFDSNTRKADIARAIQQLGG
jgi:hypothetical protein